MPHMLQDTVPPPSPIDYYTPRHHPSGRLPRLLIAILIAGGVVIPVLMMGYLTLVISSVGVDWPMHSRFDAMVVLAHPLFAWPFYTLALMASVAVIRLIRNPSLAATNRWVRVPLSLGVAINVQYLLVVAVCMVGATESVVFAVGDAVGALIFLAFVLRTVRESRSLNLSESPLRIISWRMGMGLLVWFGCVAVVVAGLAMADGNVEGLILAPLAFVVLPHLQIIAFSSALLVVRTLAPSPPHPGDRPEWILAYASGWTTSGAMLVWAWYFHPMHSRPSSYIATAASRGHRRWVGGRVLTLPDGRDILVNRQLHRLITLELLLAYQAPQIHRLLRGIYDRVGPPLAAGLTNPWLADIAYLCLKPLEWTAAMICRLSLPREKHTGQGKNTGHGSINNLN